MQHLLCSAIPTYIHQILLLLQPPCLELVLTGRLFLLFLLYEVVTRSLHPHDPLPSAITLIFSLHSLLFETLKTAIIVGGQIHQLDFLEMECKVPR